MLFGTDGSVKGYIAEVRMGTDRHLIAVVKSRSYSPFLP